MIIPPDLEPRVLAVLVTVKPRALAVCEIWQRLEWQNTCDQLAQALDNLAFDGKVTRAAYGGVAAWRAE